MSKKAVISSKDERLLHTKSGNRCALCKAILVDTSKSPAACIGENAHIYGEKEGSARYDSAKEESFVNSESNLIFVCCNCHKKIDTEIDDFPVDYLFEAKAKHEKWVSDQLEEKSVSYSFAELEVLSNYLVSAPGCLQASSNLSLLKIGDKINKNFLQECQKYITMGLSSNLTIEEYFNKHPDPSFAIKLTNIMAQKYQELKNFSLESCEIFYELWEFASGQHTEFSYRAAGLGILTYFFEKCEVFEK